MIYDYTLPLQVYLFAVFTVFKSSNYLTPVSTMLFCFLVSVLYILFAARHYKEHIICETMRFISLCCSSRVSALAYMRRASLAGAGGGMLGARLKSWMEAQLGRAKKRKQVIYTSLNIYSSQQLQPYSSLFANATLSKINNM